MKRTLPAAIFLLLSATTKAQTVDTLLRLKDKRTLDSMAAIAAPYLRVSKSTSTALTTSWQTINMSNSGSTQDVNNFTTDVGTNKPYVWYDTTTANRLFKFSMAANANFLSTLYINFTTNLITTRATIQYRFVIPNGVSAGVDYYFPFPNSGGYGDFAEATILANGTMNISQIVPLYLSNSLRTNGMYLQMRLSNSLITLGTCTLNNVAVLIQQTK